MKRVILDTNAYRRVSDNYKSTITVLESAEEVCMSPVVLGELFAGFKNGTRESKNKAALEFFMYSYGIRTIEIGSENSEIYANLKHILEKKGRPIPVNDIWIAAQAIETGSVLVTYDDHFKYIPGLRIWNE